MNIALDRLKRGFDVVTVVLGSTRIPMRKRWRILRTRTSGGRVDHVDENGLKAEIYGIKIEVPRSVLTDQISNAIKSGGYEACEVLAFDELVQQPERILEVGSGIGFLSAYMARDKRSLSVVSIEADPRLLPVATRTGVINGVEVQFLHRAIGSRSGEAEFALHPDFWASSTETWPGATLIKVPMQSLTECLAEFTPTMLVLDIEGAEYSLLAESPLDGVERLIVETHPWQADEMRTAKMFSALKNRGFRHVHRLGWGNVHGFVRLSPSS